MSSSEKEMSVNIIELPEDIILKIFSHLSVPDLVLGVRPTCQYFHKLSLMPNLWKHVKIIERPSSGRRPGIFKSHEFFLGMLHQKCIIPTTNESVVDDGNNEGHTASNDALTEARSEPSMCVDTPHTTGITLSYDIAEMKSLVTSVEETGGIMGKCFFCSEIVFPCVKNVKLVNTDMDSVRFLSQYRELNSLHIEVDATVAYIYRFVIEDGVQCFNVLKNLKMLKTLTFVFPSSWEVSGVTDCLRDYFLSRPTLTQLHLDILVQDTVISTILDSCSQLEHFHLSNVPLTAGAFRSVQWTPNCLLSCLKLTNCPLEDDRCVHAILKGFTNLKHMELTIGGNVSDLGIRALLCGFPQLTVLKLLTAVPKEDSDFNRPCGRFSNDSHSEGDDDIDEEGGFFCADSTVPKKGKLQILCLDGFGWLEPKLYSDLFMNNPKLQKVALTDCLDVLDGCLQTLSESCLELKSVNIHKCSWVSPIGVSVLISQSKYLKKVQCTINDSRGEFVRQLSRLGKDRKHQDSRMQVLCLHPWYDVSEKELTALTTHCSGLLHLVITGGRSLTDDCVEVIMRNCPRPQTIRLEMGPSLERRSSLSSASLQHVQQWGRHLQQAHWLVKGFFPDTVLAHTLVHSPSLSEFIITAEACQNVCIMGRLREEMRKLQNPKNITIIEWIDSLMDSEPLQEEKTLKFCVEKVRPSAHAQNQVKWEQ